MMRAITTIGANIFKSFLLTSVNNYDNVFTYWQYYLTKKLNSSMKICLLELVLGIHRWVGSNAGMLTDEMGKACHPKIQFVACKRLKR